MTPDLHVDRCNVGILRRIKRRGNLTGAITAAARANVPQPLNPVNLLLQQVGYCTLYRFSIAPG